MSSLEKHLRGHKTGMVERSEKWEIKTSRIQVAVERGVTACTTALSNAKSLVLVLSVCLLIAAGNLMTNLNIFAYY